MADVLARSSLARPRRCSAESLEPRCLLSAAAWQSVAVQSMHVVREAANSPAAGISPVQIRRAYGFDQLQSSGAAASGSDETIAIVDAYDDPNIASDLNVFDQQFGINAPPSFVKVYAAQSAPRTDAGWSMEAALDVEWTHAIAPAANIVSVEARSDDLARSPCLLLIMVI